MCSGIAEEMNFRTPKCWRTIGKYREQRRRVTFYRGKEEAGRGGLEYKSIGGK